MTIERPPADRFEMHYIPEPNSGCWLWFGAQVPDGYGSFYWGHDGIRNLKAHRAAWKIFVGPIPEEMQVLHTCDVRCCVNPDHLFLGDNADNVADRVAKGRSGAAIGPDNPRWIDGSSRLRGTLGQPRGERMGTAKLTELDVIAIRIATGTQSKIAERFGVSQTLISQVKLRRIWDHVD